MSSEKCDECGWSPDKKHCRPKSALMEHYYKEHGGISEGLLSRQQRAIEAFRSSINHDECS